MLVAALGVRCVRVVVSKCVLVAAVLGECVSAVCRWNL